jgi:sporulation protein YlmC with PRC-barrel domain
MNRLDEPLDAALHLLDRQVIGVDGRLVCKVDDLELREYDDGTLAVTALLAGAPVLVPRLGGRIGRRLGQFWGELGLEQADRMHPFRIELDDVDELVSAVLLTRDRDRLLRAEPEREGEHRITDLLGMTVSGPGGRLGRVLDVRLEPTRHPERRLRVVGLLVGKGRPGTLLGYDRREEQGPWLLARLVRTLHRHTVSVPVEDVEAIDWDPDVREVRCSRSGTATR